MEEDYFLLKKLYGNNEDVWEEIQLLEHWRIEQLEKETKLRAELNQLNSQYSEVCCQLNTLEDKLWQLTNKIDEMQHELNYLRANYQ